MYSNGGKNGVMHFNASARASCNFTNLELFGERVYVVKMYVYLGRKISADRHLGDAIAKAKRRSADVFWG
jgi:hypothetical protein